MQAPIGDTQMKTRDMSLMLLVALAAACGDGTSITAPPLDTGTSVTSDGGTPTPDVSPDSSSPAADASVDNDATPPNDTPVVMNDAGPRITCETQVLSNQNIFMMESGYRRGNATISSTRTPAGLAISLVTYGFDGMATCNELMSSCTGNVQVGMLDSNGHEVQLTGRFEIRRMMLPTGCSPHGDITVTRLDTGAMVDTGVSEVAH